MIHTLIVRNRHIVSPTPVCVQNNRGFDRVQLVLDSEWEGMTVVLSVGGVKSEWAGEPVPVPEEALATAGTVEVGVSGYLGDVRLVTAKSETALLVVESGPYDGDDPYPEQPNLLQTILEAVQSATEAAERANEAAEVAETATGSQNDYELLSNLPSINGVTVMGAADSLESYGAASLTDETIANICV